MTVSFKEKLERLMAGKTNGHAPPRPPAEPAPRELPAAPEPFPMAALPPVLRDYVDAAARAIGCDPALVALPALAAAAGAVGNSRAITLKRGWSEPAVVWAVTVAQSGAQKSPAFAAATAPLYAIQMDAVADKGEEKAPSYVTADASVQSLGLLLKDNPRGVLLARDELDGWFQSFTRFSGPGGATDRPHWLELHRAGTLRVHRVSRPPLSVRRACCSLTGTIQPLVLARALTEEALAAGLGARFLVAAPAVRRRRWTEAEVADDLAARYRALLHDLLDLEMDDAEQHRPAFLRLAPDAKAEWVRWYDAWGERQHDAQAEQAALLSKLEGYAARLALVHHVVSCVAAGSPGPRPVGVSCLRAGIVLAEWFAGEALRLYDTLRETAEDREARQLLAWLRERGGRSTASELQQSRRGRYPRPADAEAALHCLKKYGWGDWTDVPPGPKGGRPTREFRLNWKLETPESPQNSEVSSFQVGPGEGVAAPETVAEDEIPE